MEEMDQPRAEANLRQFSDGGSEKTNLEPEEERRGEERRAKYEDIPSGVIIGTVDFV